MRDSPSFQCQTEKDDSMSELEELGLVRCGYTCDRQTVKDLPVTTAGKVGDEVMLGSRLSHPPKPAKKAEMTPDLRPQPLLAAELMLWSVSVSSQRFSGIAGPTKIRLKICLAGLNRGPLLPLIR
jgi:hypothetical protein